MDYTTAPCEVIVRSAGQPQGLQTLVAIVDRAALTSRPGFRLDRPFASSCGSSPRALNVSWVPRLLNRTDTNTIPLTEVMPL